ncbi:MAG: FAD-binding oxidoreductase [Planctomycetes bacterium]|nr:FAD-binding oxidoreductase [Planctomycetota bacterium]
MTTDLPGAEIVIVGGGAVGCGAAYALARAGKRDIVLVEREDDLARITTSQGAGLAGQVRSSVERVRLAMRSVETFRELERDPVARPGWRPVGSLRIAETPERVEDLDRLQGVCAEAGLEVERIGLGEAARLWPGLELSSAKAVLLCPTDGCMDPPSVARAYAHQCRQMGVRFVTSAALEEIAVKGSRVEAALTSRGRIECRYLVDAAGAHAYHVARLAGLELPIVPVRHEYFVSVAIPGIRPDSPCLRLPDAALYARPADGGLLLGGWEGRSVRADPRSYGLGEAPPPLEPDREVLGSFAERFAPFVPAARGAAMRRVGKGWPTFTPDGRFIIGESSRVKGFVMAGGCNAHGISGSGGIGALLVESLLEERPSEYARSLSPDRFTERSWDWEAAAREAQRVYERYYAIESC